MIFEVAIGDRVRTVGVVRKGGLLHVDLDGRAHVVDARRVNDAVDVDAGAARRCRRAVAIDRRGVCDPGRPPVISTSISTAAPFRSRSARPARSAVRRRQAPAPPRPDRSASIAPMPGKVVRVLVKPGDEVKARQGLVVVEAMKMENELRAARDGRVRDVAVAEGQSVDAGAVLLIVE